MQTSAMTNINNHSFVGTDVVSSANTLASRNHDQKYHIYNTTKKEKSENRMIFALNLSHPGLEPGTT